MSSSSGNFYRDSFSLSPKMHLLVLLPHADAMLFSVPDFFLFVHYWVDMIFFCLCALTVLSFPLQLFPRRRQIFVAAIVIVIIGMNCSNPENGEEEKALSFTTQKIKERERGAHCPSPPFSLPQ